MADVLELFLGLVAWTIYGTDDRPRHIFQRGLIRAFAFGGSAIVAGVLLRLVPITLFPIWVAVPWFLALIIVMLAEHELGRTWIAVAAMLTFVLLGLLMWGASG